MEACIYMKVTTYGTINPLAIEVEIPSTCVSHEKDRNTTAWATYDKRGYFDYSKKDKVVQPYTPDFLQHSGKVRP